MTPVSFFRAFPMTRETLCSEPVVAWAHALGHKPVTPERQAALWMSVGTIKGCDIIAQEIGAPRIVSADVGPGDAVMLRCLDGAFVLGVYSGDGFSVAAASGKVHVGRFDVSHGWRL